MFEQDRIDGPHSHVRYKSIAQCMLAAVAEREARYVTITYFPSRLNLFSYKCHIFYCVISCMDVHVTCIKVTIQDDKTGDVRTDVALKSVRLTVVTLEKQ
jgi:hypothetical protein